MPTLDALWAEHYPSIPPLGYRLREALPERWLRVHDLPDGKRYATDDAEAAEILRRMNAVATSVLGEDAPCWLVVAPCELGVAKLVALVLEETQLRDPELVEPFDVHGPSLGLLRGIIPLAPTRCPAKTGLFAARGRRYDPHKTGGQLCGGCPPVRLSRGHAGR